jgi:hypothetical protein
MVVLLRQFQWDVDALDPPVLQESQEQIFGVTQWRIQYSHGYYSNGIGALSFAILEPASQYQNFELLQVYLIPSNRNLFIPSYGYQWLYRTTVLYRG